VRADGSVLAGSRGKSTIGNITESSRLAPARTVASIILRIEKKKLISYKLPGTY
jgi:hypothetical protein